MARQQLVVAAEIQAAAQCLLTAADDSEMMECVMNEGTCNLLPAMLITVLNDGEAESHKAVTVENFIDVTVPAYSQLDFKQHFRLKRSTFEVGCLM